MSCPHLLFYILLCMQILQNVWCCVVLQRRTEKKRHTAVRSKPWDLLTFLNFSSTEQRPALRPAGIGPVAAEPRVAGTHSGMKMGKATLKCVGILRKQRGRKRLRDERSLQAASPIPGVPRKPGVFWKAGESLKVRCMSGGGMGSR